jgi:protocatechuate 3,4-dioxygenase beta subunit
MSEPGTSIQLTDGQTFDKAVIALPRGGIITGRVTDENGEPLVRVQVYTLMFQPGSSRGQRTGGGGQTDDLGQFRLFGLQPAEYVVAAEARSFGFVGPNVPQSEEDKIGFLTTYYPGTPDEAGAQRVRVAYGAETPGIEIRLAQGRLFRVTGTVVDSQGRALARSNIQLTRRAAGMSGMSSYGASSDEQGQFQIRNVPPGNYRLIARDQRANMGPMAPGAAPATQPEAAVLPLTIAGDVENVLLTTGPGVTITGHLVFEQGPPATLPKEIRVMAQTGSPEDAGGLPMPPAALVTPELTFTMKGLMGEYLLRTSLQGIRSITVGADDITDTPREFKANDRVTITLTSRTSTLEGVVTDTKGPAAQAGILLFSEEKTSWRANSTRLRRATTDQNGQFRMMALTPGRYYILAAPRERLNIPMGADLTYFEQLAKEATTLVIGDDEQRRIDLKVSDGSGG